MTKATNNTLGTLVRHKRMHKGITRIQLAKKLQISVGYLGHIETDNHVRVSPRIVKLLNSIFETRLPKYLIDAHNEMALKWNREWNQSKKTSNAQCVCPRCGNTLHLTLSR